MDPTTVVDQLQRLISEEMHLLGQSLEDSLHENQSHRLEQLTKALDNMDQILAKRRNVRP